MDRVCLIACQGSAQLVAAMVAAGVRLEDDDAPARPFAVLVHDLHAPQGQDADFFRVVERVAQLGRGCQGIRYLSRQDVAALQRIREERGLEAAGRSFVEQLALGDIAEIYLGQNPLLVNDLLRSAFRDVRWILYGDGLGMNFTPRYFAPEPPASVSSKIVRRVRSTLGRLVRAALPRRVDAPAVDTTVEVIHRLLLPNLFDERLAKYEVTDAEAFKRLFEACTALQPAELRARYAALREQALRASSTVILLSTNFSEARKMTLEAEIEAYSRFVGGLALGPSAFLIIKPHPRDSHAKVERIRTSLEVRFANTVVLDDPSSFYLPFEVIYAECFGDWPESAPAPTIAGFSTAVLALEYIYGARCTIGFGHDLVQRLMAPEWRQPRLRHERDLHAATMLIHRNRTRALVQREWPHP